MSRLIRSDRGVALLIVVIALAALSLLIGALVETSRQYAQETVSALGQVELRAGLDAGFATAVSELSSSGAAKMLSSDKPPETTVGDINVRYSVRPESSKIDLNAAPKGLIEALLEQHGFDRTVAQTIAGEIDSRRRAKSASAGSTGLPQRGHIRTESELALLEDGGPDLVACLAPDVTVFTGSATPYIPRASQAVRNAVAAFAPASTAAQSPFFASLVSANAQLGILELDLTAEKEGRTMSRQSVVRITGNPRDPVWILAQGPVPLPAETDRACARARRLTGS